MILVKPLNSFVFAVDGVLQGAEEFTYQTKLMALSVVTVFGVFTLLYHTPFGKDVILGGNVDTLVNIWYGLLLYYSPSGDLFLL